MKRTFEVSDGGSDSEMAIVDTFTKLIFGEESEYSDGELRIIQALRAVDDNVALDCHGDMGVYLRALGVREMIGLVSRVRSAMVQGLDLESVHAGRAHHSSALHGAH